MVIRWYSLLRSWSLHQDPGASNPTWVHHLDTYGKVGLTSLLTEQ